LPTVSDKYLDYAESLSDSNFQDLEMSFRAFGEDGFGAREVREKIRERNLGATFSCEQTVLDAVGCSATESELSTFSEFIWSMEPEVLTDYDSFRESLPVSWRMS